VVRERRTMDTFDTLDGKRWRRKLSTSPEIPGRQVVGGGQELHTR
jgi:hypothetical protein